MTETETERSAGDSQAILEELRNYYSGRYGTDRSGPIEEGRVRDYLLAMDEPLPDLDSEPVPPLFLLTVGRTRRPQPSKGSAVNAGDEFEFQRPVFVGDRITVSGRVTSIEEKQGRKGVMYLIKTEETYTNQHDKIVAVRRGAILRWGL